MKAALLAVPVWLVACASPAPPEPRAEPPATAAPASAPPAAPRQPSARVGSVEDSKDSVMNKRVKIIFENPTKTPCRITSYRLDVGAWHKDIKLDGLTIPPGETRDRWLRINPEDGAPADPPLSSGSVTIKADCSP